MPIILTFPYRRSASGGSIELRTRNAKFLAELAKFGLLSPSHYFDAVRACADELVSAPHTIDTVCALLETGAGRFFYAQPETHLPLVALIERMTVTKKARVHDAAQVRGDGQNMSYRSTFR